MDDLKRTDREAMQMALDALMVFRYASPGHRPMVIAAISAIEAALAAPEPAQQEPYAYEFSPHKELLYPNELERKPDADYLPLYTAPPQRQPQFKEFIKWAGAQGYDCAQTCNSDTGQWIVLNPMTADLWKAWQAAHGIKEKS
jgi:hypothetical protein